MSVDASVLARTLENTLRVKSDAESKGDTVRVAALQHCVDALLTSMRAMEELPLRAELASCQKHVAALEIVKQNLRDHAASIQANLDKCRKARRVSEQELESVRLALEDVRREVADISGAPVCTITDFRRGLVKIREMVLELRRHNAELQIRLENICSSHAALDKLNRGNIVNISKACHQSDATLRARISQLESQATDHVKGDKQRQVELHNGRRKVAQLEAQVARQGEELKLLRAERRNERRKTRKREHLEHVHQQPPAYDDDDVIALNPPDYSD